MAVITVALAAFLALPAPALISLAACGLGYNWLIAAVPVVVRRALGHAAFSVAFRVVFTPWGVAVLLAPTLVGRLFDQSG